MVAHDEHVRRLWRHRIGPPAGPRRGPRPQLDLDEILVAGIAIADADGLAAVSLRAVAARFDKTAMALYAYVGTKEQLLALMQDHASAMPPGKDPSRGLEPALRGWALALFDVYMRHPWLTSRPWSQPTLGPNEQDWLERLVRILNRGGVPAHARPPAVTMLYATVRACAETSAGYRQLSAAGVTEWQEHTTATTRHVPDLRDRYPLSTGLEPLAPQWQDAPRAGLLAAVRLLATALT
jgi:AcrR family transcriptional regulator